MHTIVAFGASQEHPAGKGTAPLLIASESICSDQGRRDGLALVASAGGAHVDEQHITDEVVESSRGVSTVESTVRVQSCPTADRRPPTGPAGQIGRPQQSA